MKQEASGRPEALALNRLKIWGISPNIFRVQVLYPRHPVRHPHHDAHGGEDTSKHNHRCRFKREKEFDETPGFTLRYWSQRPKPIPESRILL